MHKLSTILFALFFCCHLIAQEKANKPNNFPVRSAINYDQNKEVISEESTFSKTLTSQPIRVTGFKNYCKPTRYQNDCIGNAYIAYVGIKHTSLSNSTTCQGIELNASYLDTTQGSNLTARLQIGGTYELKVVGWWTPVCISAWIDYNNNGVFDAYEWINVTRRANRGDTNKVTFTVPTNAVLGPTGFRVTSNIAGNYNADTSACGHYGSGETEDYYVELVDTTLKTPLPGYCTPYHGNAICNGNANIAYAGIEKTTLSNSSMCPATGSYIRYLPNVPNHTATLSAGSFYKFKVVVAGGYGIVSAWIDFNQDKVFSPSEWINITRNSAPGDTASVWYQIPGSALPGQTVLRIRSRIAFNTNADTSSCSNFASGESQDYSVTIVQPTSLQLWNFNPNFGNAGAQVLLYGNMLNNVQTVKFNGLPASFTHSQTDSVHYIAASVPGGATTGKITIVSPTDSAVSAQTFYVGNFSFLDSISDTTCQKLVLDHNPLNDSTYKPSKIIVKTFKPNLPGHTVKIDWNYFRLRNRLDLVRIYDGSDTLSNLVGEYTDQNLPPTVLASNREGKLTVYFKSDTGIGLKGFSFVVSCVQFQAPTIGRFEPAAARAGYPIVVYSPQVDSSGVVKIDGIPLDSLAINYALGFYSGLVPANVSQGVISLETFSGKCTAPININILPGNYCAAHTADCDYSFGNAINRVKISQTALDNYSACNNNFKYNLIAYAPKENATANLVKGSRYQLSVQTNGSFGIGAWIDYDHSNTFDVNEYTRVSTTSSSGSNVFVTLNIPNLSTTLTGLTAMRIRSRAVGVGFGSADACTAFFSGETEDYMVNILPSCSVLDSQVIVSSGGNSICRPGGALTLTAPTGYVYLWNTGATTQSIKVDSAGTYSVKLLSGNCSGNSLPFTVYQGGHNFVPAIVASGALQLCSGKSLTLSSANYSHYIWSTGDTSQSITVDTAGTYTLTVVTSGGCTSSVSAPVRVSRGAAAPPAPQINFSGNTNICLGDSVELRGPSGFDYFWSNRATSQSVWVRNSGYYQLKVANAGACFSDTSVGVQVVVSSLPSAPVISYSGSLNFCSGDSVLLTASNSAGYYWSTGQTTQSIKAGSSGSITVAAINASGCTSQVSQPVVVTKIPKPSTPVITSSGPTTFCKGGAVTLTASAAPGLNYVWNTGATTRSIRPDSTGSYMVYTVTANGCSSLPSVPVMVKVSALPSTPFIQANGPTTFCPGDSVVISTTDTSGALHLWSNGQNTKSLTVKATGNYTLRLVSAAGCTGVASLPVSVAVSPPTPKPVITPSGPVTFCDGDSVTLTAPIAATYQWSNGATSHSITTKVGGKYSLRVVSRSGCASVVSDTVFVTVNQVPALPSITVSRSTTFCDGDSVILSGPGGMAKYIWSNGAQTQSVTVKTGGNYSLKSVNSSGCTSKVSQPILITVNPAPATPVISFAGSHHDSLTASGTSASYIWLRDTVLLASHGKIIATGGNLGSYRVISVSVAGCSSAVSNPFLLVGVKDKAILNSSVFPNPFKEGFTVQFPAHFTDGQNLVELIDETGRTVFNRTIEPNNRLLQINLSELPSGMYLLRVVNRAGVVMEKLRKD